MIFRRSLVREMTATAVGLFLVLLGILFTNLVLKLLARAAGGAVAPEGILALLGLRRHVLFQHLAVGHRVPDRPPDALALVPGQRDDRLVYLRPGTCPSDPAGALVRRAVLSRHRRTFAVSVSVGRAAADRVRTPAGVEGRARPHHAGAFSRVPAGQPRRLRRQHQYLRRSHPQRLPALDRRGQGRDDGGPPGHARRSAQRRSLHRPDRRQALRRQAGHGRIPGRRIREAGAPDRAGRTSQPARLDQGDSDRRSSSPRTAAWSAPSSSGGCRCRFRRWC